MKVSHVALLSIVGMLVASLSVLVFTSPRESSSRPSSFDGAQDAAVLSPIIPAPSSTFRALEAPSSAPSAAPVVGSSAQTATARAGKVASLQLTSTGEPCTFFIDGKRIGTTDAIIVPVRVGPHVVRCERLKSLAVEQRVDVAEEAINPVFF